MPRKLTRLKVHEISSVDRGAGEGVRVLLLKRKGSNMATEESFAKFLAARIEKARAAFSKSLKSIIGDDQHDELINKSADQLIEHIGDVVDDVLKAADGDEPDANKEGEMSPEVKKALGLPDNATAEQVTAAIVAKISASDTAHLAELAKRDREIAILKLSPAEREWFGKLAGEAADKFLTLDENGRRAEMLKAAPAPLSAELVELQKRNASLEEQVKKLNDAATAEHFRKVAVDLGLSPEQGELIRKAESGDRDAQTGVRTLLKSALTAARDGGVFKELGSSRSDTPSNAYEELLAKAHELRKADPKLTEAQAFAKVYADPTNLALVRKERGENRPHVS